jgi:hypothetical protein
MGSVLTPTRTTKRGLSTDATAIELVGNPCEIWAFEVERLVGATTPLTEFAHKRPEVCFATQILFSRSGVAAGLSL